VKGEKIVLVYELAFFYFLFSFFLFEENELDLKDGFD
jgi:hypothetical protein